MPSPAKFARLLPLLCLAARSFGAPAITYHVTGDDAGSWPRILNSIGLFPTADASSTLNIVRAGAGNPQPWLDRINNGATVVLEGESALAEALGFHATAKRVTVRGLRDTHAPQLEITWEQSVDATVFEAPKDAVVFAREHWTGAPLLAAVHRGSGSALWLAVPPGPQGFERFPYLLQALTDIGLQTPFRSGRLWAFFDGSYRSRVDLDYFAVRWREAGISALQVAGWHNFEPDAARDRYLQNLIEACHRQGVLVYVWLELPHVSEQFWADHPEWREKTALGQDAQLDWRKLMNLQNPAARAAVKAGVQGLLSRFDWDGVNLAELYFESLEGASNPARFTPMNNDVRRDFEKGAGYDPATLFNGKPDREKLGAFLSYRAELARKLQEEWIGVVEEARAAKPDLGLILTHVDDRFDAKMRELIGADAGRVLPLLDHHDFTFLVEDPATLWNLGPQRYAEIAKRYGQITKRSGHLAIDLNIVERYQDVYPTKQQTGAELAQLVHQAAESFGQVALYGENSILSPDWKLLPAAAASVSKAETTAAGLTVAAANGTGVEWTGDALVDGQPWPVADGRTVWLPPGTHTLKSAPAAKTHLLSFNGDLRSAAFADDGILFAYANRSRATARLDFHPIRIEIDGESTPVPMTESGSVTVLLLPRGQHLVQAFSH